MDTLAAGYRALAEACVVQAQALSVQQHALMRMRDSLAAMADLLDRVRKQHQIPMVRFEEEPEEPPA